MGERAIQLSVISTDAEQGLAVGTKTETVSNKPAGQRERSPEGYTRCRVPEFYRTNVVKEWRSKVARNSLPNDFEHSQQPVVADDRPIFDAFRLRSLINARYGSHAERAGRYIPKSCRARLIVGERGPTVRTESTVAHPHDVLA